MGRINFISILMEIYKKNGWVLRLLRNILKAIINVEVLD
ncbi:hypothetical protein CLLU_09340 [Clostridium luticellarii]|uniref:Uncharacterized protein n=1 Tax=Clostridium luticellarii TaxID=1691940 RepID=A0A2T0BQJ0_9CLOT|nr:hypothetical protein CLLU_09340 [Clostridium luticellarii]